MEKTDKEELAAEVTRLRAKYRSEKERLEWVDDDYEESLIREEMLSLKERIKTLRKQIESLEADTENG